MNRKFTAVQKSCGWQNVQDDLNQMIGEIGSEDVFMKADAYLRKYEREYRHIKGMEKMHVTASYTTAALYYPLKDIFGKDKALSLLDEGAKKESLKKRKMLEKLPGKLFLQLCRFMTAHFFNDKAGFVNEDISQGPGELRFNILRCPYCTTLQEIGCPEVCPLICRQDEYSYGNMKNCTFGRTETLGTGGKKCDFLYRI